MGICLPLNGAFVFSLDIPAQARRLRLVHSNYMPGRYGGRWLCSALFVVDVY